MKLFSPQQAKIAHNYKQEEDIQQIAYLTITLKKLQETINTENSNWEKRREEQRKIYGDEKIVLQEELRIIEKKIKEKRKDLTDLLIPIDGLKERAEENLKISEEKLESIAKKEEEITELQEMLTDKIDRLTEREVNVAEKEIKIESRLKGIEEESEMVSKGHKQLNEAISLFHIEKNKKEKELTEREKALEIKSEKILSYLEEKEKDFTNRERSLADRYKALERTIKEVEKKLPIKI